MLFIGNSFTERNGGLDKQLERLAPSVQASSVVFGGFTLRNHWTDGRALESIRQGGWSYVVLQDQSVTPVLDAPEFYRYGQAFDEEIRRAGANTVLLMTWERPDAVSSGVTTKSLASAYDGLGRVLGDAVAPAGVAFADSLRQRPDLQLTLSDGHPTVMGTYLAGCVVFGTLFGETPVGHVAADPTVAPELQAYFQKVAAVALGY